MIAAPNKKPVQNSWSISSLTNFVAGSVRNAREGSVPFYHLQFDRVFPPDFYAEMLRTMPDENDYRPMSGKARWAVAGRMEDRRGPRLICFRNTSGICPRKNLPFGIWLAACCAPKM